MKIPCFAGVILVLTKARLYLGIFQSQQILIYDQPRVVRGEKLGSLLRVALYAVGGI